MVTHTISIHGRVPSKKNSKRRIQRGHNIFMVPSEAHEVWHAEQMLAMRSWRRATEMTETIDKTESVKIVFVAGDKRKADLSNKAESIMDLLVDAGILADDNWFVVPELTLACTKVDKENAGAQITIITS